MPFRTIPRLLNFLFLATVGLIAVACEQKPEKYLLLFEHRTENSYQIYTVQPDGTELTRRFDIELGGFHLLSPDGRHMAIYDWGPDAGLVPPGSSNGSLSIVETISGNIVEQIESVGDTQTENLPNFEEIIWSPTGDKLLFIRDSTNAYGTDIWLYDLSARQTSQLTAGNSFDWSPAWSPDEEQIAFVRLEVCGQSVRDCPPEELFWNVFLMDADGTNQRIITNFQDSKLIRSDITQWLSTLFCDLTWSPDSQYIALRDHCGWQPGLWYNGLAFLIKTDGSQIQRLTDILDEVETDYALLSDDVVIQYSFDWLPTNNNLILAYTIGVVEPQGEVIKGFINVDPHDFSYDSFQDTFAKAGSFSLWSPNKQYVIGPNVLDYENENGQRIVEVEMILARWENNNGSILPIVSQLPKGSYDERKIFWSSDNQFVVYSMTEFDENERGIAIISLADERVTNVLESLPGNNRPIGWISSADAKPN